MPRGRPKKVPVTDLTPDPVEVPVESVTPPEEPVLWTPLSVARERQEELLALREAMVREGVDSISKLDVLLSQANEEVRKLS